MGIRRTVCVGMLLGGALVACGDPPEHELIADRVSEGVSGRTVDEIADAVSWGVDPSVFEKAVDGVADVFGSASGSGFRPSPPLAPALEAAGDAWPEALLAGLIRAKGGTDGFRTSLILGDEGGHAGAVELRERPAGRLDAELLALVVAPTTPTELWSFALSNLVRPESAAVRDELVAFVMDVRNDPSRRRQILLRLPQLQAGSSERLDDLLYLCGGGMDEISATVAAIEGRNVAMSLVVDLAESMARSKHEPAISDGHPLVELAAHAALALCRDDPNALAAAREILGDETVPFADPEVAPQADQSLRQAVAAGLRRLMEDSPELLDTPFERDRRIAWERAEAMVASAPESITELAGLPDDEIDLATAALSFGGKPHPATAESFERMMILLERDVRGRSEPHAIVAAIRARLCGPQRRLAHVGYDGLASDLWSVMSLQCGNCVGGSILWGAIADRLELPIHAVSLPGHCAVVWDDGTQRMILETTARAEERDLAFFRDVQPLADVQDVPEAQVLRPLSETGLLSLESSNAGVAALRSWYVQSEETWRSGLRSAERALVLDPHNRLAVTVAAELAAKLDDSEIARTLARLDTVAADPACSSYERFGFAKAYLACGETGRADEQLRLVEAKHADDPRVEALREEIER